MKWQKIYTFDSLTRKKHTINSLMAKTQTTFKRFNGYLSNLFIVIITLSIKRVAKMDKKSPFRMSLISKGVIQLNNRISLNLDFIYWLYLQTNLMLLFNLHLQTLLTNYYWVALEFKQLLNWTWYRSIWLF